MVSKETLDLRVKHEIVAVSVFLGKYDGEYWVHKVDNLTFKAANDFSHVELWNGSEQVFYANKNEILVYKVRDWVSRVSDIAFDAWEVDYHRREPYHVERLSRKNKRGD